MWMYNGKAIPDLVVSFSGQDATPIGTIISFMGTMAPKDYLVCDGSIYQIGDYPDLAEFFNMQFGSANHFGGDGVSTFAAPDLRNMFLRGYHGDSEEELSGEIGEKQDATDHMSIMLSTSSNGGTTALGWDVPASNTDRLSKNIDSEKIQNNAYYGAATSGVTSTSFPRQTFYTARPVNTAVLYCIKAKRINENVYSIEEQVIGTWIDGRPLYRKVIIIDHVTVINGSFTLIDGLLYVDTMIKLSGFYSNPYGPRLNLGDNGIYCGFTQQKSVVMYSSSNEELYNVHIFLEYTKITDASSNASLAATPTIIPNVDS